MISKHFAVCVSPKWFGVNLNGETCHVHTRRGWVIRVNSHETTVKTELELWEHLNIADNMFLDNLAEAGVYYAALAGRAKIFLTEGLVGVKRAENETRTQLRRIYVAIAEKLGVLHKAPRIIGVVGRSPLRRFTVSGEVMFNGMSTPQYLLVTVCPDITDESCWDIKVRFESKTIANLMEYRERIPRIIDQVNAELGITTCDAEIGNLFHW